MKSKFLKLILSAFIFIFLSVSVLAHSASLTWTMNKPNYELELYPCTNSVCSGVGSIKISTASPGYVYNMYYNTPYYDAYHAAYFYKPGYRPIGYVLHSWGDPGYTWVASFSDSFEKKDFCESDIGTLTVSDSNPLVGDVIAVSAPIDSAFTVADDHPSAPKYYPASHADYFTSDIKVLLNVYDSGDDLVMTLPAQTKAVYQDGSASVSFNLDTAGLAAGTYTLKFSTDPIDSICDQGNKVVQTKTAVIEVEAVNTAPIISGLPDQTVSEDSGLHNYMIDLWDYAFDAESADPDLTFTMVSQTHTDTVLCGINANRYIDCVTQADMFGSSVITIEVEDPEGLTDSDTFTVTVTPVNDAPVVSDIPSQTITEGESFTTFDLDNYVEDVEDSDADITWTVTGNTELEININSNHVVTITYPDSWTGSETLTFTAEDTSGLTDSDEATFTAEEKPNESPVIDSTDVYMFEDSGLNDNVLDLWDYASDAEDDVEDLTFAIVSESDDSIVDCEIDSNRHLDCTTQTDMFGVSEVTIEVEDTEGLTDTDVFNIHVQPVNDAPVVSDIPGQTITEGESFTTFDLDNYVTDIDNTDNEIEWTVTGNTHLDVDIDSNHIATITYPDSWTGSETLTFTAEDTCGLTDSDEATFTVEEGVNEAPEVSDVEDQTITEGESFATFDLDDYVEDAEDSDADITWTVAGNTDLEVNIGSNHVVTITYPDSWTGSETLTFTAEDTSGLTDSDQATLTVEPVATPINTAPVIEGIPDKVLDENSGLNDDLIDLWNYASDAESSDSELTFTIIEQTKTSVVDCEIDSNRYVDCEVKDDKTGYSFITVQVEDPEGLKDTDEFKVRVREWSDDDEDDDGGRGNLEITKVSYDDRVKAGDYMHINVYVKSETNDLLTGVFIDGLGVYESFAKTKGIHVQIPNDAAPGKYELRIAVDDGHDKDVVYRDFYVVKAAAQDTGSETESYVETPLITGMTSTADVIDGRTFLLEGVKGVLMGLFFLLIALVVFLIIYRLKNR